jgi:hypothetical protein
MEKLCKKCDVIKPLKEFGKHATAKDGIRNICNQCTNIRRTQIRDPEKTKKQQAKHKANITLESFIKHKIAEARGRSKKNNKDFDIDFDWIIGLHNTQGGLCAVSGIKMEYAIGADGKRLPYSMSIDRIDCNKGYTKNNVRLVCMIVNLTLGAFGDDILDSVMIKVAKYNA